MPNSLRWPDALVAGFTCSSRTFAGPGALAARGRITGRPRTAVYVLTVGEMITDKTSLATDRTEIPAVGGRLAAGAYTGREIAGNPGAAAGLVGAAIGSYALWRARSLVVDRTGLPDPVVAVGEDVLAYGGAAVATRPGPEREDRPDAAPDTGGAPALLRDAGKGLIAGLAGTAAMTLAQGAEFVLTPAKPSQSPATVAGILKQKAGFGKVKRKHRAAVNQGMHWLFGTSWGIPYGLLAARRGSPEITGPALGLVVWAAALGHQPAFGIAEVPWKRSAESLGSEALFHVVYGVGAGAALRWLREV